MSETPPPNPIQRNPLVIIGIIVSVLQFIVSQWGGIADLLLSLGVPPGTVTLVQTIITVALTLLGVFVGRAYVTPLADPRDSAGKPLVAMPSYNEYREREDKYAP